jgi:hypothetical protein
MRRYTDRKQNTSRLKIERDKENTYIQIKRERERE